MAEITKIGDASERGAEAAACSNIPAVAVEDVFGVTPMQEGMWTTAERQRDAYNYEITIESKGKAVEKLKAAWRKAVELIPMLRTFLVVLGLPRSQLVQVVLRNEFLAQASTETIQRLEGFGLARLHIAPQAGKTTQVIVNLRIHHALFDGWAMMLLLRSLRTIYEDKSIVASASFRNFIEHLGTKNEEEARTFWSTMLSESTPTEIVSRQVSHEPATDASVSLEVQNALSWKIAGSLSGDVTITASTVIQTAWAILAGAYAATDDVLFATITSGRDTPIPGIVDMQGPTMAVVPCRVQVDRDESVCELLERVARDAQAILPYQDAGLLRICHQYAGINVPQNLLVIQPRNLDVVSLKAPQDADEEECDWRVVGHVDNVHPFALVIECWVPSAPAEPTRLSAYYDSRLLSAPQARRLLEQLSNVIMSLKEALDEPGYSGRVGGVKLASPDDVKLIKEINSHRPLPVECLLHELFAGSVISCAGATAVDAWDGTLTYSRLDELSDIIAGNLRIHGVGAESRILLFSPKSSWVVVAVVGILKCGAAFVPLEPTHPDGRLRSIAELSGARLALTHPELVSRLKGLLGTAVKVLDVQELAQTQPCLDGKRRAQPKSTQNDTAAALSPSSLAYIIFTSGTTGVPKGVELSHRAVCSSIMARSGPDGMNMTPFSRVLHFTPYCFDAFIDEVLMTVINGACVCVPREAELRDDLCGSINRYRITWACLTPSVARILDADSVSTLQTLSLVGEAVLPSDVEQWRGEGRQLFSGYGPTETCVVCVVGNLFDVATRPGCSYLGRPRGCLGWVVDPGNHDRLSPIGAAGELLIEGPNLARGYLADPESTRSAWVPAPFSSGSPPGRGRLAYRTGDLVRMCPDGSLFFLGRIEGSSQTKLRGQRFELSEVEHHVRSAFPGARQVVSVVFTQRGAQHKSRGPTAAGSQDLALAFVPEDPACTQLVDHVAGEPQPTRSSFCPMSDALKGQLLSAHHFLMGTLPSYMIPSYWVPLRAIPLMPSLKADRRAIAQLLESMTSRELALLSLNSTSMGHKPAISPTEVELTRLCGSVLGVDPSVLGITDDFVVLGGDSVKAMRLAGLCRSVRMLGVTTALILRLRTIEAIASVVDAAKGPGKASEKPDSVAKRPASSIIHQSTDIDPTRRAAASALATDESAIQDVYPATPLQSALFTLGEIHKHAYRGLFVFEIPHGIGFDVIQRAWAALKAITPVVRTRLFRKGAEIWQAVVEDHAPCTVISMRLDKYLDQERQVSRAMTFGSTLFSVRIVVDSSRPVSRRNYFVLSAHHSVYDGWSIRSIMEELEQSCYEGCAVSRSYAETNPYSRFVHHIKSLDADASREFWLEYLAGYHFAAFLDLKGPCSQTQPLTDASVRSDSHLPETPFTASVVVHAAWSQLVAVYTGTEDVVFGVTSHGRDIPTLADTSKIVGPTIATFPLRVRVPLASELSGFDFLAEVEAVMGAITPFEHYGLDMISKASDDARSACNFHSLVIVQASAESMDQDSRRRSRLMSTEMDVGTNAHPYPLVVEMTPVLSTRRLHMTAHYDSSLLDGEIVRGLLAQLGHLIQETARVAAIGAKLQDVQLLCPTDASRIWTWNSDAALPLRVESCVHEIVAEQTKRNPHAIAVCGWDATLSYFELERLSSHLVALLFSKGVVRRTFVPICLEKSSLVAICQLAVLKAGAACVLIDPKHPTSRNREIIAQCRAKVVIVSVMTKHLFAESPFAVLVAEEDPQLLGEQPPRGVPAATNDVVVDPKDPAYCVFTSGSTGSPKGVVIEHTALCTSARNYGAAMGLGPRSRVLQFASCSFDVSVGEVLTTLMHGGCVCVPKDEDRLADLGRCVVRFGANWLYLTSSVACLLKPEEVPCLKTLVVGGEAVQQDVIRTFAESHVRLINAYGPAETTIYSSLRTVSSSEHDARDIGKAVGCRMWISCAQDHRRLAPIGAVGEILIDGPILARGYLNPMETAAVQFTFVPFLPGHRVYRTGDLACYDAEGNFHFRGRHDTQVKLNGQRIDLGEIEAKLLQSAQDITQTAVVTFSRQTSVPKADGKANIAIAALFCLTGSTGSALDTTPQASSIIKMSADVQERMLQIKKQLEHLLPTGMVPSVYIPMSNLPRTTSLKLDRKAARRIVESLPEIELRTFSISSASAPLSRSDLKPAYDDLEYELLLLWSKVLGYDVNSIGTGDSFVALGGNSISAMQLVWQARSKGLRLAMSDVLGEPTISSMAQSMRARDREAENLHAKETRQPFSLITDEEKTMVLGDAVRLGVASEDVDDIYPATDMQVHLLIQTEQQADLWVARDRWELPAGLDVDRFRHAWEAVVEGVPVLRTRILQAQHGSEPKAYQIVMRPHASRPRWDHGDIQPERRKMGFGLPLSAQRLFIGPRGLHVFEWIRHHACYDGWSIQLILGQLADQYRGRQISATLPFSVYVRSVQVANQEAAQRFWESELADLGSEVLSACSFPRRVSVLSSSPIAAARDRLTRAVPLPCLVNPKAAATLPTVLRAAWALTIAAYTGSQDVLFGEVESGRSAHSGLVDIVGPTLSLVPRRFRLSDQLEVGTLLSRSRRQVQDAIPYQTSGLRFLRTLPIMRGRPFNNCLVIQSGQSSANGGVDGPSSIGLEPVTDSACVDIAYPFGLVLECVIPASQTDQFVLLVYYDNDLIPGDAVSHLVSHFAQIISQLLQLPPETVLADVSIWTRSEVESQLLVLNNGTPPAAVESCAHELIARHWHPDSQQADCQAVCNRHGAQLTYRDLEMFSRVLSRRLLRKASFVSEHTPFVAICFEKSIWTIVAMVAVWRAGGAVVLLDPNQPRQRLHATVLQTKAILVLVSPAVQEMWNDLSDVTMKIVLVTPLPVDPAYGSEAEENDTLPDSRSVSPNDACYCVFTSGSSAQPKGIIVQHRAICTSAISHGVATGLGGTSRVLQFSSYSFDVSIDEMLTTLIHGGVVCVVDEEDRKTNLAEAIREMDVNVALLTPGVLETLEPGAVSCLGTLVVGGSSMSPSLKSMWENRVQLLVAYGPSECSITATMNCQVKNTGPGNIGRPLGCRAWVLGPVENRPNQDHTLRLVPLGCVGELVIEGPILAQCYLEDKSLTAQRFVPASSILGGFCEATGCQPDSLLYKTGDLVKQTQDGSLVYIGRRDNQLKVRGVRVEPEAIENCILETAGTSINLRHAIVALPAKGPLADRLVAVLEMRNSTVSASDTGPSIRLVTESDDATVRAVKEHVEECLPPSHIPTIWTSTGKMAVLPSGKIDRAAIRFQLEIVSDDFFLGSPENTREGNSSLRKEAPSLEAQIKGLMGQVLGTDVSSAPANANFARLGGDSLHAMQLVARAKTAGINISLAKLLANTSIPELAAAARQSGQASQPPAVTLVQSGHLLHLSPAQSMFFSYYPFGPAYFNQSISIRVQHPSLTIDDLRSHLGSLVVRHAALRSRFHRSRDEQGLWSWKSTVTDDVPGSLRFRSHVLQSDSEHQVGRIAGETQQSLNISDGPLIAADVFLLEDASIDLLLVAHHLVVDIVSWSILLGDLESLINGLELDPAPSPTPFTSLPRQDKHGNATAPAQEALEFWGANTGAIVRSTPVSDPFRKGISVWQGHTNALSEAIAKLDKLEVGDVIEAVVVKAFTECCRERGRKTAPAIYVEEHGRINGHGDFNTAVGWLTRLRAATSPERNSPLLEIIWNTRERRLRSRSSPLRDFPEPPFELVINYVGRPLLAGGSVGPLMPSSGQIAAALASMPGIDPGLVPLALIEVLAEIRDDALHLTVTCDARIQDRALIQGFCEFCHRLLQDEITPNLASLAWHSSLRLLPVLDSMQYGTSQQRRKQLLSTLGSQVDGLDKIEHIWTCTTSQEQILLSQARDPDKYRLQSTWEVDMADVDNCHLNLDKLRNACQAVIRHHPSLRTAFCWLPDLATPVQVVLRDPQADVLRVSSFKTAGRTIGLLEMKVNHACFDGASTAILLRDISLAYHAEPLPLDSTSAFQSYVSWVKQVDADEAKAFWAHYLEGVEPCQLPHLGTLTGFGASAPHYFDGCLRLDVSQGCRRLGVTPAVAIHLAWALALGIYTGRDDVCFGWLSAGRDIPVAGTQDAIGMYANLLICRARVGPEIRLEDAVANMACGLSKGLEHEHSGPRLQIDGRMIFDTLVTVQQLETSAAVQCTTPGLRFNQVGGLDDTEVTLLFNGSICKDSIEYQVTYRHCEISETSSRAFLAVFEQALAAIIATTPGSALTLGDIDLFPPLHLKLAQDLNAGVEALDKNSRGNSPAQAPTVVSLFLEQVRARPLAIAVEGWDATFTFLDLYELSTSLCHHLVHLGLSRGQIVPLLCEKSAWVVVSLLAVLRLGAVCTFLSGADGVNRLKGIIAEQIGSEIIISSPRYSGKAKEIGCGSVVILDPDSAFFTGTAKNAYEESLLDKSGPGDDALVCFTSGSTGRPKGIRLSHAALCSSILDYSGCFGISHQSRIFQFSAYTFDVGIGDMFASLMAGAVLCVPSEQARLNDINGAISHFQATFVMLTPSMAALLRPDSCGSLETIVLIGEPATAELYKSWQGRVHLFNAWGPAECSVLSSFHMVKSERDDPALIGIPTSCRLWLVSPTDSTRLVPVGSVGEILVEGRQVALGYLNDPDRTREAFIHWDKSPEAIGLQRPGTSLYLTGDLARLVPGQGLVFKGRKDLQIKLRGQRVELGEVEYHVGRAMHEGLQEEGFGDRRVMVVVDVGKRPSSENFLAAFLSLNFGPVAENKSARICGLPQLVGTNVDDAKFFARLSRQLVQDLPQYMVPSVFLPIRELPTTPSGKLDRTLLRKLATEWAAQATAQTSSPATTEPPDTELMDVNQRLLRGLWAKALNVDEKGIGLNDNFFSLGGDSILAIRLAAAALDNRIRLLVTTVMRYPHLSSMAAKLLPLPQTHQNNGTSPRTAVNHVSSPVTRNFPATNFQEAMLAFHKSPERGFLNYFILSLNSSVAESRVESACRSLLAHHEVLCSSFFYSDGRLYQYMGCNPDMVDYQRHKSSDGEDLEACVSRVIEADRRSGLGQNDCLTKFFCIRQKDLGTLRLVIRLSHALYDGMCLPTLWRDLSSLYGDESPTPDSGNFSQFALSVVGVSQAAQKFWRGILHGAAMTPICRANGLPAAELATGAMAGRETSLVSSAHFTLPSFTPASVLKAAWAIVLAGTASLSDVVFGQIVSCRETLPPSMASTVGAFVNCIPVRALVDPDKTIVSLVRELHEQQVQSLPHNHVGLRQLVEHGCVDWSEQTHFGSIVQYQNLPAHQSRGLYCIDSGPLTGTSIAVTGLAGAYCGVWVTAFPMDTGNTEVVLQYNESVIDRAHACMLLVALCAVLRAMCPGDGVQIERLLVVVKAAVLSPMPRTGN